MIGKITIIAAVVIYLSALVGCIITAPADSPGRSAGKVEKSAPRPVNYNIRRAGLPFRGASMQLTSLEGRMDEFQKSIDEIAAMGLDTVEFVVAAYMEHGGSSLIYVDARHAPSASQFGELIDYAKGKNLRVIVMPIVLLDRARNNEWRGTIKPDNWEDWWNSYRDMLRHYAKICEKRKVDVLVVGSELVSTEERVDEWTKTIDMARDYYHGMLTYSANWDHYTSVEFWDQLDLFSTNSYYKLGEDKNVSVDEIVRRWADIQKSIFEFQKKINRPFMFTEVGWCSVANAAHEPWDYTQESVALDLDLQRKLYEGFFKAWHGQTQCGGFMIWEWPPGEGGNKDRGYIPKGKPAEKVLKDWIAKPKWEVK